MKPPKVVRRSPRQARSQGTVDILFAATMQIIEQEGIDKITMKRVADVSGYSIGTLYQYFDDSDSMLMAMVIMQRDRLAERLKTTLADGCGLPCRDAVREFVGVLVSDTRSKRRALQAVARSVSKKGMFIGMREVIRELDQGIGHCLAELAARYGVVLAEVPRFVASRSLRSVLWSAVMENSDVLESDDLAKLLHKMVVTIIIGGDEAATGDTTSPGLPSESGQAP